MLRAKAAPGVAAPDLVASLAARLSPARAEASRKNGAKSKGPRTPEGKARSAQNALKHGLRAQKYVVLPDEGAAAFDALETALMEELAPEGALQTVLARRVVAASWRLERAERLEAELFAHETYDLFDQAADLGLALIRDCNGAGAFDTLLRYRGGTLAELWRALRTLKALQAERAAQAGIPAPAPRPIEPEARGNHREIAPPPAANGPQVGGDAGGPVAVTLSAPRETPIEPEARTIPGGTATAPTASECVRADRATQTCSIMRHSCAIDASPSDSA
jgi:hypothetical protein